MTSWHVRLSRKNMLTTSIIGTHNPFFNHDTRKITSRIELGNKTRFFHDPPAEVLIFFGD